MADEASLKIVIVWAEELHQAAVALSDLQVMLRDKTKTDAELGIAYKSTLEACWVALRHVSNFDPSDIVLSHGDRLKFVPRDIQVVKKETP